jgi:hypothetical protein
MRKVIYTLLVFLATLFSFSVTKVSAAKILSNDKGMETVAKGEVVNDDLFVSAQTAEIDGIVNGDVFIGAQTVDITGTINGNLHIGTQTLNIEGVIKGNVYAGAQSISVTGSAIGGSLIVGTQNLNVDSKTTIGGSILAGGASVQINSQIKRNVLVGAGTLTMGADTVIGKDLYYAVGQNQGDANISESAKVGGTIHKAQAKVPQNEVQVARRQIPAFFRALRVGSSIISFIGALIIGFIYLKLFEKHFKSSASLVENSLWKSLGIGFLTTVAFIPAEIILLITIIGIPVAGLSLLILLIFIYLSKLVVGLCIGNWVSKRFKWKTSAYGAFVLGLLIYYILRFIPVIGGLTGIVVLWVGLGALILQTFSKAN